MSEIDSIVASYERNRSNLFPLLQNVQEKLGFLSEEAVDKIAAHFSFPPPRPLE